MVGRGVIHGFKPLYMICYTYCHTIALLDSCLAFYKYKIGHTIFLILGLDVTNMEKADQDLQYSLGNFIFLKNYMKE